VVGGGLRPRKGVPPPQSFNSFTQAPFNRKSIDQKIIAPEVRPPLQLVNIPDHTIITQSTFSGVGIYLCTFKMTKCYVPPRVDIFYERELPFFQGLTYCMGDISRLLWPNTNNIHLYLTFQIFQLHVNHF
jgi:hypothetical protein